MADLDIPLYDPTKPIACSIEAADIPKHLACLERIKSNLQSVARTRHGLVLHLADSDANAADVDGFVAVEQRCCEFWGSEMTRDGEVALRWDGPSETAGFMDGLVDYLHGRLPVGALFGRF